MRFHVACNYVVKNKINFRRDMIEIKQLEQWESESFTLSLDLDLSATQFSLEVPEVMTLTSFPNFRGVFDLYDEHYSQIK